MGGHGLLLPYLLALDAGRKIESPQASHCKALVGEAPVEEFAAFLQRLSRPLLQCVRVSQKLDVLGLKDVQALFESDSFIW